METQPGRVAPLNYNLAEVPPETGPLKRAIVEPFENKSAFDDEETVALTREAFVEGLHASERLVLVSPRELRGETLPERLADARQKGVSVLIRGAILDISSRQSGDHVGLVRQVSLKTTATIELVAYATSSGQELFRQTETATMDSHSTRVAERSQLQRYAAHNPYLTHQAIRAGFARLMTGLLNSLHKVQWQGRIALIEGERIFVNAGQLSGLRPGDILRVSEAGQEIYDPETGQLLGESPGRIKGTLEVISFFGKDGTVALIHSGSGFQENDLVELY